MSLFDLIFWLLIALIAVLAYSIESGLSARHRTVVLSSILSATVAAVYIMFLVEDNTSFDFQPPPQQAKGKKKKKTVVAMNQGAKAVKKRSRSSTLAPVLPAE